MIFHLAERAAWEQGLPYEPDSLDLEGFIHCSTASRLIDVANALYSGRQDLVLVTIDPGEVEAPLVWEDCYDTGTHFPHIYGPLTAGAIVDVRPFPPGRDGRFSWSVVNREEA